MAKSIRSKAKMAARRKKRESGNYHAADAARVARLSARLLGKKGKKDVEGDEVMEEEPEAQVEDEGEWSICLHLFLALFTLSSNARRQGDYRAMLIPSSEPSEKKVSTSAPRGSRKNNWRNSKGVQGKRGKVSATGLGGGKRPFKPNRRR